MNNDTIYQRLAALINKHTSFSILLPINPTVDSVAAAIGLYFGLTKLGKSVTVASTSDIPTSYGVAGADKVQKSIATGGDNLVVSFPYSDGSIDKVTYNIEGNLFNLVIQPREGYEKLDPSQVKYTYAGGKVDSIIVIDAPTLNSLGDLYTTNQDQFKGKDIINIDRHLTNGNFGTINLLEKKMSSTCEIIMRVLSYVNIAIDKDLATTLYNGIVAATNNFSSYSVNPDTFEASAYLLKSGAVKKAPLRPNPVGAPLGSAAPVRQPYNPLSQPFNSFPQPLRQPANRQPMDMQSALSSPAFDNSESFDDEEDMMFDPIVPQQLPRQPMNIPPQTAVMSQPLRQPDDRQTVVNQSPIRNQQADQQQQIQQQQAQIDQIRQQIKDQPSSEQPVVSAVAGSVESREPELKKVENKETKPQDDNVTNANGKPAPKDWLKPKIFRGSNLV